MADFVAELMPTVRDAYKVYQVSIWAWKIYVDGAFSAQGIGIGSLKGIRVQHSFRLGFKASNNEAN